MRVVLLQGGSEFRGGMKASDLEAMAVCGGRDAPIIIIPAAAAPDGNHERAGTKGERWFRSLGATDVRVLDVIDRRSADDPELAAQLRPGSLIYLLGGFPGYLARTLAGSSAWAAMGAAFEQGALLAGSSAGAMVLCEHLYDPERRTIAAGLGLVRNACVLPHHNSFGRHWVSRLRPMLPQATLIGIDEETGVIGHLETNEWAVRGRGEVVLYRPNGDDHYTDAMTFGL